MTITKSMIVGAKITDIYRTYEIKDGLDFSIHYFRTDRGFDFILPTGGFRWTTQQIPSAATPLEDHLAASSFSIVLGWIGIRSRCRDLDTVGNSIYRVRKLCISQVLCEPFDPELGFRPPDEATLLMSDGSTIRCTTVAPHGIGAGLSFRSPSESMLDTSRLDDYFSIPLNEH